MAFFKFRKAGSEKSAAPAQTESVEALRRRARHRLIGAAVLVLVGVLGFPLLFDTQPRPVAVDIPIEIPDRNKVKPLTLPVSAAPAPQVVASQAAEAPPASQPAASPSGRHVASGSVTPAAGEPEPEVKAEAKAEAKAQDKPVEAKEAPKAVAAADKPQPATTPAEPKPATDSDADRARALLEGKPMKVAIASKQAAAAPAAEGRFVVQVGAFADPAKARETRLKVERAGLKTYTHVAETKDGKRTRVRVGPFDSRAEADKAAGRIKALDLPAAILTL
ncbi:SPOR domain-containing protein [Ramlibacter sp.]|uniref:SPOR domain-containing protein n=1 Tax=Ramlibacter sp. TaxID=1917967 RepID=UPI002D5E0CBB|nr:SPOR domain-containing protein [Ramlibacter sp.]HYD77072.1 SPOR domain-containing protein [Ramlibacter sp.]